MIIRITVQQSKTKNILNENTITIEKMHQSRSDRFVGGARCAYCVVFFMVETGAEELVIARLSSDITSQFKDVLGVRVLQRRLVMWACNLVGIGLLRRGF